MLLNSKILYANLLVSVSNLLTENILQVQYTDFWDNRGLFLLFVVIVLIKKFQIKDKNWTKYTK